MDALELRDVPLTWQRLLTAVAVGKAAIGGAGFALAILGAYNVAAAISANDWLHVVQHAHALDTFAAAGGILGALVKLIFK